MSNTDDTNTPPPQNFEDRIDPVISINTSKLNEMMESRFKLWQETFLKSSSSSIKTDTGEVSDESAKTISNIESKQLINHVSFKPPQPLFGQNPLVWFTILEQRFNVANIKLETTKYSHAVGALDARHHNQFADLIIRNKGDSPYTIFKNEVIKVLSDTEKAKLNNVLHNLALGDKKPSQLLNEFRLNAGNSFNEKTIQQLWMKRLPQQVQMVLSAFENDVSLTILAERADNLVETLSNCQINSVNAAPSTSFAKSNHFTEGTSTHISTNFSAEESYLDKKLSNFLKEISSIMKINSRSRTNSRSRSNSRNSSNSPARGNLNPKHEDCWYHYKFGNKALKCVSGCKFFAQFSKDNQNNSKND